MPPKKILLVEGPDDEHVFKALFGKHQLPHLDEIKPCGGYESLVEILPVQLKASNVHSLGVVVDADTDVGGRWQSVRMRLIEAGYDALPAVPGEEGAIVEPPNTSLLPRLGVWIMPNNRLPGILEDFFETARPRKR